MLKKDLMLQILRQIDLLPIDKNKTLIGLMKDELGGQIMKEVFWIKSKNIQLSKRQQ